tara:strand:- start:1247 stop:2530 length:1284 start_codon:yes stop_codon:yes gene_type:complete
MDERLLNINRPGFTNLLVEQTASPMEILGESLLDEASQRYAHRAGFNLTGAQSKLKTVAANLMADGASKSGKYGTPYAMVRQLLWRYLSDKFPDEISSGNPYPFAAVVNKAVGELETAGKLTDEIKAGFQPWLEENFAYYAAAIFSRVTGSDVTPDYVEQSLVARPERGAAKIDEPKRSDEIPADKKMSMSEGGETKARNILRTKIAKGNTVSGYLGAGPIDVAVWEPSTGELEFSMAVPSHSPNAMEVENLTPDQIIEVGKTISTLLQKIGVIESGEVLIYPSQEDLEGTTRIDFDLKLKPEANENQEHEMDRQDPREAPNVDHRGPDDGVITATRSHEMAQQDSREAPNVDHRGPDDENEEGECKHAANGCTCTDCDKCAANSKKRDEEEEHKMSPQAVNEAMRIAAMERRKNAYSQEERYGGYR